MKSLMNSRLELEEVKGVLGVYESAHYRARWGQAVLPADVPRVFGINAGKTQEGAINHCDWFEKQNHMGGMAMLVRKDTEALKSASEHDQAVARRAVVFILDDAGVDKKAIRVDREAKHKKNLEREQEFQKLRELAGKRSSSTPPFL